MSEILKADKWSLDNGFLRPKTQTNKLYIGDQTTATEVITGESATFRNSTGTNYFTNATNGSGYGALFIAAHGEGTSNAPTATSDGQLLGGYIFGGWDSTDTSTIGQLYGIFAFQRGASVAGDIPVQIIIGGGAVAPLTLNTNTPVQPNDLFINTPTATGLMHSDATNDRIYFGADSSYFDVNGFLALSDGSAATPSLTNTTSTTTGLYFPAADQIGITTDGVSRWIWDSNGQMESDQSVTIPAVGSGFVIWDRKDMYFTGTQTVGSGGNIGGTTILFADHIVKYATSQGLAGVSIFDGRPTIRPTTGVTDNAANVSWRTYFSAISFSPELSTAVTATTGAFGSFFSAPSTGVAAGSHASAAAVVPSFYGYLSNLTVGAQSTATIGRHFWVTNATVAGTLTTQVGLDIETLTTGGTNIGIRNASTYVSTPSTAQNITAVGNTILANAETVQLTANANYTLTSAPTIANGQDGQVVTIVNVDTADTITIQDQGTLGGSNLRLSAATIALAPRDSIQLMYSSTVGDWVQIGQTNVI